MRFRSRLSEHENRTGISEQQLEDTQIEVIMQQGKESHNFLMTLP